MSFWDDTDRYPILRKAGVEQAQVVQGTVGVKRYQCSVQQPPVSTQSSTARIRRISPEAIPSRTYCCSTACLMQRRTCSLRLCSSHRLHNGERPDASRVQSLLHLDMDVFALLDPLLVAPQRAQGNRMQGCDFKYAASPMWMWSVR